jgi:putative transposase
VQVALGELVGAAREGLLALSVGVGLGVMHQLMAEEVERWTVALTSSRACWS